MPDDLFDSTYPNIRLELLDEHKGGFFKRSKFRVHNDDLVIQKIPIPKGFLTDGFSLPPLVRSFYDPFGDGIRAAILHDYLLVALVPEEKMSRREAAHYFKKELIETVISQEKSRLGALRSKITVFFFYESVRLWDRLQG